MPPNERIELAVGHAPWLRAGLWAVGALALAAIITARTTALATTLSLLALCVLHLWVLGRVRANASWQRLTLDGTGNAILFHAEGGVPAQPDGPAWISRWFCVVPLRTLEGGHLVHCVVCRSRNHPDHYRHLLVRLRLSDDDRRAPSALP